MKTNQPTVISLFCGIGGLDLGFVEEGFNIVWANDFLPEAVQSYSLNFSHSPVLGNINEIDLASMPNTADVIIGGPPCQSFSLVGVRNPDDPRGQLVFRFLQIVKEKKPRVFLMENVPGISSSSINGKNLLEYLTEEFANCGYHVKKLALNANDYMVPQLRKRVLLIGSLDNLINRPDPVAFARNCYDIDWHKYNIGARAAIGDLGSPSQRNERSSYSDFPPSSFASIMRRKGLETVSLHEMPRMSDTDLRYVQCIPPGGNYQDIPNEIATGRVLNFKKTGGRTTTYGRLHPDNPSYTINTYFRRPNVGCNFHYEEARLITPREAMRFQSIPDHFEIVKCSQDTRNSLIGNAVPPFLARALAWEIKKSLVTST